MEIQKELQKILSRVRAAVERYEMIEDGDRIAVGISGGKDSLTMLYALAALKEFLPRKFELVGLQIDMGFDSSPSIAAPKNGHEEIRALCDSLGVPYHVKETEIAKVIFDIRKERIEAFINRRGCSIGNRFIGKDARGICVHKQFLADRIPQSPSVSNSIP